MLLLQPSIGVAATAAEVEALYDRSGDKLVDAEDWKKLSKQERRDYVKASLNAFSAHQSLTNGHRVDLYFNAISHLYHYK